MHRLIRLVKELDISTYGLLKDEVNCADYGNQVVGRYDAKAMLTVLNVFGLRFERLPIF